MLWDPSQYARFSDHRSRPFHELVARIGAKEPEVVYDVGAGPGDATATLASRWPHACVTGWDSSAEMVESAQHYAAPRLSFREADARDVDVETADVVVSNAMLQWLPDHRELLDGWLRRMRHGAWLAFQVPGNFDAPSHRILRETAASGPWAARLAGVLRGGETVDDPADYAGRFLDAGWDVDAWETTYTQWLPGEDPVFEWVKGTAMRPVYDALAGEGVEAFEEDYKARLREAYPSRPDAKGEPTTAFGFRRLFVVGRRP